jgi:hypothetical protein
MDKSPTSLVKVLLVSLSLINIYFVFLHPNPISLHCAGIILRETNIYDIQASFRGCDGGSLIFIARDFLNDYSLGLESKNFLSFWPPGVTIFHILYLTFFVNFISVSYFLSIIYSICNLILLFFLLKFADSRLQSFVTFIFFNFYIRSSISQGWFSQTGLFYQEFFGAFFFLLSFLTLFLYLTNRVGIISCLFAGIFLGFAAYFRATF